jgi:hypothetical protein
VSTDLSHLDHFCPNPGDSPYWNESVWFSFSVPEREIHGFIYCFFRPNMNMVVGGPAIWDNSGNFTWDCLHYDWPYFQAIPEGAKKFDFTAPNSTRVEVLEPLQKYRLGYDNEDCKIDLIWTGTSAPSGHLLMEAAATGATNDNRGHLEQCGRAVGTITLFGETIPVDCFSLRDCSYGVRSYAKVVRGSYFWGIKSEGDAFHTMTIGDGDVQAVSGGFLMRDGKMAALTGGERRVTRDGKYTPAEFDLDLVDELGRTLSVHGYLTSHLLFTGYPEIGIVWSLLRLDYEGQTGHGDVQEFLPRAMFRRRMRGLPL